MPRNEADAVVRRSLTGLLQLVLLQVGSHGLTFLLNTMVIRRLAASLYGFSSVQLQLLVFSILFMSRAAVRTVCQRLDPKDSTQRAAGTALAWAVVPIGAVVTFGVLWAAMFFATEEERGLDGFAAGVALTAAGAAMELLAEPVTVAMQMRLEYRRLVAVEGAAVVVRCAVTFVLAVWAQAELGALVFAYAWAAYGVVMAAGSWGMYAAAHGEVRSLLPTRCGVRAAAAQLGLLGHFYVQTGEMWLLTEGQKLVMKSALPLAAQAHIALVANLGSLAVRMAFRPLEDVARALFARHDVLGAARTVETLQLALRAMAAVGLVFACFAPAHAFALVDLLYSSRYSSGDAPSLLGLYGSYVLLLALNGVLEAFVRGAGTPDDIRWYNRALVPVAVLYLLLSFALCRVAAGFGLVVADMAGMVARILLASAVVASFARRANLPVRKTLSNCLPHPVVLSSFIVSLLVTLSTRSWDGSSPVVINSGFYIHSTLGATCLILSSFVVYYYEGNSFRRLKTQS